MAHFRAYLISAVKEADIVRNELLTSRVVKYNEDTGIPFQKEILTSKQFIGEVETTHEHDIYEIAREAGLEVFHSSDGEAYTDNFLGLKIGESDIYEHPKYATVQDDFLNEKLLEVREKLISLGVGKEPQVFLILSC
jgi:hypothetical protein